MAHIRVLRASIGIAAAAALVTSQSVAQAQIIVGGVGWEGQGADLVVLQLDSNPRPDIILMANDNPAGPNTFRYRVGLNLNAVGQATWLAPDIHVPGVGDEAQGAGAAVANLDCDPRPELILVGYDNPAQGNSFRYRIGWNLDAGGQAVAWTLNHVQIAGAGWEGQGAAVVIGQIDSVGRPDMILVAYDNPAGPNSFRYHVGLNLGTNGQTANWTSNAIQVGGLGWEGQGIGAALVNLTGTARPDLVLMAYDNPAGGNSFRFIVGVDLNTAGMTGNWQGRPQVGGVGWEGQGAGLAITNLDSNPLRDWIAMAYDNPPGGNTFRYRVIFNQN